MPARLPLACTKFPAQDQTNLAVYAQNIHDMILAAIATFPTPPILPVALQTLIDAYVAALNAALLLGKVNTSAKNASMKSLKNALRADCSYVNQIVQDMIASGTNYTDAETLILSTGYALSISPSPAGPLPSPVILIFRSTVKTQLYLKVGSNRNSKGYQVNYRPVTTPASDWSTQPFPSSRITIDNLVSGTNYEA